MNTEFVKKCYPTGTLKPELTKRENHILKSIFNDIAYSRFLESENAEIENVQQQ